VKTRQIAHQIPLSPNHGFSCIGIFGAFSGSLLHLHRMPPDGPFLELLEDLERQ
jgi:hypothetical protein